MESREQGSMKISEESGKSLSSDQGDVGRPGAQSRPYLYCFVPLFLSRGLWGGGQVEVGQRGQVDLPWSIHTAAHSLLCTWTRDGLRLATSLSLISSWLSLMFIFFFFRSVDEEKRLVHTSDVTVVINFIVDRVIPHHGNSRVWSYSLRQLFRHRSGLPSCL